MSPRAGVDGEVGRTSGGPLRQRRRWQRRATGERERVHGLSRSFSCRQLAPPFPNLSSSFSRRCVIAGGVGDIAGVWEEGCRGGGGDVSDRGGGGACIFVATVAVGLR
jgi:hypothetical protein